MSGDDDDLSDLLEETRILLPGAELLAAFLTTLPFTDRFSHITDAERVVYVIAFLSDITALASFLTPAAYHRVAQPIRDKAAFKIFANRFIVFGLVPFSLALSLVSYLVTSIVVSPVFGAITGGVVASMLVVLWWIVPYSRAHNRASK